MVRHGNLQHIVKASNAGADEYYDEYGGENDLYNQGYDGEYDDDYDYEQTTVKKPKKAKSTKNQPGAYEEDLGGDDEFESNLDKAMKQSILD